MGTERLHSEIADLLKEAEQELNTDQMKWDRFLVHSFFTSPGVKTHRIARQFQDLHNLSEEHFFALKRVPARIYPHMRVEFSRFVCAFLPTIATVLWEKNKEDADKIAVAINKTNVDTRKKAADESKLRSDRNAIRSNVSVGARVARKIGLFNQNWKSYNRNHQWGVTK